MRPGSRTRSSEALLRARKLRTEPSISEKLFWECVRKDRLGFRFKRQTSVGAYTLDFYCPEASLCVEIDGEQHDQRKPQDLARDRWLASQGIETIRIPSLDLFERTGLAHGDWLRLIKEKCEAKAGRPAFPDMGGN